MNKGWLTVLSLLLSVVALISVLVLHDTVPRIGYVQTPELVYSYLGTREAQRAFEREKTVMLTNLDTLKSIHQSEMMKLNQLDANSDERKQQQLRVQQSFENVQKYQQNMQQRIDEQDQKMMTGVLNQINSFASKYGETHGYDMILATTTSGNILYGREADDLTEDMLKALNDQYSGIHE
ncbi:MAG: hypothetical protein GC178_16980 [Flavobacteriales bacterium]|nr:hypothetical protein [Flavobacteriales bacterium]